MNHELTWKAFVYWVIAGMGTHVGWGLISLVIELLSSAVHRA